MEKKKSKDIDRKNSILFKQRRNQLHSRRIQGTARKEKQEGPTYESGIGMNLEQSESGATITGSESITGLLQLIKGNVPKETITVYEGTISPFTPRPICPNNKFDSNLEYNIIVFDVETNTTGKAAQLCQLSAVDKTGQKCFSEYILPDKDIDKYATRVNKQTVKSANEHFLNMM
ncbi:exonuclease R569 [Paramuricea clavata]|uniref:Exonuclease R569 n=1 Tax=Paramuricea clavata TaxID=317549 RepID=A0A7D9IUG8_PARCT|nr:exonuclease R569 [Paramuricea clavata]